MNTQKKYTTALYARVRMALAVLMTFVIACPPAAVQAASSWKPTLLVNTESFQEIDSGDGTTAVDLRFGGSSSVLTLLTNGKFQFNKSLIVKGGISGSYLTIDRQANISGALMVRETITARSTVSGANLTFMGATNSYILGNTGIGTSVPELKLEVLGTMSGRRLSIISDEVTSTGALFVHQKAAATGALIRNSTSAMRPVLALDGRGSTGTAAHIVFGYRGTFDTKLFRKSPGVLQTDGNFVVQQTISGSSFIGAGLGNCNNATTSKLIYNPATGKFGCATDQTGGTGGGNWSNTGSLQTAFDARYVNQSGDTMTGALNVRANLSGSTLRVSGPADIHGPLAVSGALRGDGDFTINDDRTSAVDAVLTFGNSTANQTLKFVHSMQKFEFSASVRVLGTISGSTLRVDGNADVNGRLSLSGATLLRSIADPSTPGANRLATFAGDLGGRTMLKGMDPSGLDYAYQPGLFQSQVMMLTAGGGTTVNGFGTTVTNDTTVSHPAASETFGYMSNFATAATLNDTAGTSSVNTTFFRGSTAGANGFFYRARIGVVDTTTIRTFVGLGNQTIATMVGADSPTGHHVGFQFSTNRADTNWQFTTKDGTTQTIADTTIAFTANKVYDLTFFCTKQCTSITWQIQNVTDGTSATGTASANLPGTSTALRMVTGVSALAAAARNIRMQFNYVEADR